MKRCVGFLLLGMASAASAAQFSSAAGRFDCPALTNSRQCANAIESQLRTNFVRRDGEGRLTVQLQDGRQQVFDDVAVQGSAALFHHGLEVSPGGRFVVIHLQFYEGSGYGLLDRTSGVLHRFSGYPLVSPDEEWIAVVGGHENADPVFMIFRAVSGTLLLSKIVHERSWWPTDVEWKSSRELVYQRTALTGQHGSTIHRSPAQLRREGVSWR